jgi:hypothetical protein
MVQSAACQTDICKTFNHTGFDSQLSKTFKLGVAKFLEVFGITVWKGHQAKDSVEFGGVTLPNLPFLFADTVEANLWDGMFWYFDHDAILGLSPQSQVWKALTGSGYLEKGLMGIKYPSGPLDSDHVGKRDDGELTLGAIHLDFEDAEFIDFPLAEGDGAAYWATEISSITYTNHKTRVHRDLQPSSIAVFTTTDPVITLPHEWGQLLYEKVVAYMTGRTMELVEFPCEMRADLGTITIGLGNGGVENDILLSPYEYTIHFRSRGDGYEDDTCVLAVVDGPSDKIGLGWPFLKKHYVVLDGEGKRVRCKILPMVAVHSDTLTSL